VSKLRWAKWFWSDWSNDTALNLCSIPAQGLWMRLLCIAAQGEPYGHVTIKGRVPTNDELFTLTCPMRRTRRRDFNLWLAELESHGVAQRDHQSAIWSPRMSHSGAVSLVRNKAAKKRWKAADDSQSQPALHKQKPPNGACLHQQKTILHTTEAEAEAESPLSPPLKSGRKKDGAWTTVTKRRGVH
jgi:hypothetical protein